MMKDMMKKTGWLLLAASFLSSCSNTENDLKEYGLRGKVKSVVQLSYEAENKFGEWVAGDPENGILFFDDDDYFGYDFVNKKLSFDERGLYEFHESYVVHSDGDVDLLEKIIFVHEDNKIVEESTYGEDGKLRKKAKIKRTGKETETSHYDKDGKLKAKFVSIEKTDAETEESRYDEDGKLGSKIQIHRKNGKVTERVLTSSFEEGKARTIYTYRFSYDKDGNEVSYEYESRYFEKGEVETSRGRYEYLAFDSHNNWTKRLTYEDDDSDPKYLTVREIEYY